MLIIIYDILGKDMFNKTMKMCFNAFRRNNKINFMGVVNAATRNSIDNKLELEFTFSQIEQLVTQYEEDASQSYRLTVI